MISTPKPPPAPDPMATAQAQSVMNRETAVTQAYLNNMDQVGPNGTLRYTVTGNAPDGTPRWRVDQTLSEPQQKLNDLSNETSINLGKIGVSQSARVGDLLSTPYDISQGAIDKRTAGMAALPTLSRQPLMLTDANGFGTDARGFMTDPTAPGARYTDATAPRAQLTDATAPAARYLDTAGPASRYTDATGPAIRSVADPILVSRQNIGSNDALAGQLFAAGRQRLDPVLAERRDNAEALLANKGLTAGSTGYERGMRDVTQGENDAYNNLFLTGQDQAFQQSATRVNTAFGQDLSRFGQFFGQGLQKAGQEFDQDLASRGFTMAANQQNFGQDLAGANYRADATARNFEQDMARAGYTLGANQQNYGQLLAGADYTRGTNQQNYEMDMGRAAYSAGINAQNFGQILGANSQNFGQTLGANQQNFGQIMAGNEQAYSQQLQNYQAQMAQRAAALQEIQAGRNQPLNEIAALLSGSQVTPQNFVQTPQAQVAPVNYTGLVGDIYKGQVGAYQAQNQARSSMFSGLGSIFGAAGSLFGMSDARLKTDISPIGRLANGLRLYAYRWKAGGAPTVGVMAQEVAALIPAAVGRTPDGWLAVDYARAMEA